MEFKKFREQCYKMIENFVNQLGLDGKYYASVVESIDIPVLFDDRYKHCKYYSPRSNDLNLLLKYINPDNVIANPDIENKIKYIKDTGLMLINKRLNSDKINEEFYVSYIHETFHALRTVLLNTQYNDDVFSTLYSDHLVDVKKSNKEYYADASQDIIKGSVDTSKKGRSIFLKPIRKKYEKENNIKLKELDENKKEEYNEYVKSELEKESFRNDFHYDKMESQRKVDEALVETMAITACLSFLNKKSIMDIVKDLNQGYKGDDVVGITGIISRHNDLELFKWMMDPLEYSKYDVNYDYFEHYINDNDKDDFTKIKNYEENDSIDSYDPDEFDKEILEERARYRRCS